MANPKSKRDNGLTLYGVLDMETATVTETVKDVGDIEYRLLEKLKEFDGKEVTITIKEKAEVTPSATN